MGNTSLLIKFNHIDRAALRELAARLERSQSATVRILVRETLAVLREQDIKRDPQKRPAQRSTL